MSAELALNVRAEHAEGPFWDVETSRLWWVDITGHRVHCFDPVSGMDCSWDTGRDVGAVILDEAGGLLLAMPDGVATFDPRTGTVATVTPVESDMPENRTNDAKCDDHGRLWVGTMAYDTKPAHAGLYVLERGALRQAVAGMTIANGPAFDEQNDAMYLADSALGLVYKYGFDSASGNLSPDREVFIDLSVNACLPDGMTVDSEGGLWVAVGRDSSVHRYDGSGRLDGKVEVPVTHPTSVAFGGPDLRQLFITTSWFDVPANQRESQPLAGSIFVANPGVSGRPPQRYVQQ